MEGKVSFHIKWTDVVGIIHEQAFDGALDGEKHGVEQPGLTAVRYQQVDELTLDSIAYNGDSVSQQARRVASRDGALLLVTQTHLPESEPKTSIQIYRRHS